MSEITISSPVILNPTIQFLWVLKGKKMKKDLSLSLPSWATRLTAHVHLWCAVELHLLRIHCGTWAEKNVPASGWGRSARTCQRFHNGLAWLILIYVDWYWLILIYVVDIDWCLLILIYNDVNYILCCLYIFIMIYKTNWLVTSCIHLAGEAPLTHGYPTLLHWCCDAAPIKSTLASGYLAEGCFLTEFTVVPGKICWILP